MSECAEVSVTKARSPSADRSSPDAGPDAAVPAAAPDLLAGLKAAIERHNDIYEQHPLAVTLLLTEMLLPYLRDLNRHSTVTSRWQSCWEKLGRQTSVGW
jgi:hypothetical protein